MLTFIGLGLYDQRDISVKGLEAVRKANLVYAEFYTSRLMGATHEQMEKFYSKEIKALSRPQVEEDPAWLEEARDKEVAFLVVGDPMISTTHLDLRLRALEMGIKTQVVHSSSIVTAVSGATGLQNYRFGRSATIPFPYIARGKRIVSQTPYSVIKENSERNLHTVLFLDIQDTRYMTVNQGVELLLEAERDAKGASLEERIAVGLARAGSDDAIVKTNHLPALISFDFGGPLHVMVVPAKLHFMEAKALTVLTGAPQNIIVEA